MLEIKSFIFNPFQVNCYVLYNSNECLIIDPSCYTGNDFLVLDKFFTGHSLVPLFVMNTHGHVDHLTGVRYFCEKYSLKFALHPADKFLVEGAVDHGRFFGINIDPPPLPEIWLTENESIRLGLSLIRIIHVPGHSPGSIAIYIEDSDILITGDILFSGSIGRTDLPGGDYEELLSGIRSKLLTLPGKTKVYPGHGPPTTLEKESRSNPFLTGSF